MKSANASATDTVKAVKKTVQVAGLSVDVFQMPDGSYVYSMTSAAKAIGKADNSFLQFRSSKRPEALAIKALPFLQVSYEGHHIPIKAVPGEALNIYWSYWMTKGSVEAGALVTALATEALTRRADAAFSVTQTEAHYESKTAELRLDLIEKATAAYISHKMEEKDMDRRAALKAESETNMSMLTDRERNLVYDQVNEVMVPYYEKKKVDDFNRELKRHETAITRRNRKAGYSF